MGKKVELLRGGAQMTPTVFILGTSHPLQCGALECGAERISLLEQEVRRILAEHGIQRIVEEMSKDGLRYRAGEQASETVCQRIAPDDVPVHFVDLGEKERRLLSFSDDNIAQFVFRHVKGNSEQEKVRESFDVLCEEVRERLWVARVLAGEGWPVLLVCGANHAESVSRLFERVGVQAKIICRDFDPEQAARPP